MSSGPRQDSSLHLWRREDGLQHRAGRRGQDRVDWEQVQGDHDQHPAVPGSGYSGEVFLQVSRQFFPGRGGEPASTGGDRM